MTRASHWPTPRSCRTAASAAMARGAPAIQPRRKPGATILLKLPHWITSPLSSRLSKVGRSSPAKRRSP